MKIIKLSYIYMILGLFMILGVFNTFLTANLIQNAVLFLLNLPFIKKILF